MKICEGCIKQDVCKFRNVLSDEDVEKFEKGRIAAPEPLVEGMSCKFKDTGQPLSHEIVWGPYDWECHELPPHYPLAYPWVSTVEVWGAIS